MRVLFIFCTADRSEIELSKGLKNRGLDLEVLLDPKDEKISQLADLQIPVHSIRIRNRIDFFAALRIKKIIASGKFDIIYAPTSRGLTSVLLSAGNLQNKIVTYRGTLGHLKIYDPASRLAHLNKRVDAIVCNCRAVHEYLLSKKIPKEKLPIIYKGHQASWYQSQLRTSHAELGVSEDSFLIACLANIRPIKGVRILVEAVQKLNEELKVDLLLIGENKDKQLIPLIKKLGLLDRVHLLGFRTDALSIISACDVSVMPSIDREGVPRAIVESIFKKVPVVCSNVGGLPEIVLNNQTGLVVKAGDPEALSTALKNLQSNADLANKLTSAAYDHISQLLDFETYVENYIELFKALLSTR
ncbi:MAG: glycosyltransferase family 4 protein [Bdellovibrionota bacterium]